MEIVRELVVPVGATTLFGYVNDLVVYEQWMPMIHDVARLETAADDNPAWSVELRAQVGPLARSKRLRMERTRLTADRLAVFERNERDGRTHSPWILRADLEPVDDSTERTTLTMSLSYGGSLWGGAVLQRVLDEQVRRGSESLIDLVSSGEQR